jgi:hypothetical protein
MSSLIYNESTVILATNMAVDLQDKVITYLKLFSKYVDGYNHLWVHSNFTCVFLPSRKEGHITVRIREEVAAHIPIKQLLLSELEMEEYFRALAVKIKKDRDLKFKQTEIDRMKAEIARLESDPNAMPIKEDNTVYIYETEDTNYYNPGEL